MELGEGREGHTEPSDSSWSQRPVGPLVSRLSLEGPRAVLTFAGQGVDALGEIAAVLTECPTARPLLVAASSALTEQLADRAFRWSGFVDQGLDPLVWVEQPQRRPAADYLASTVISQPLIFIAQVMRLRALMERGLAAALRRGGIAAVSGHSQGVMAAVLVAESPWQIQTRRFTELCRYFAWQGLHMARSAEGIGAQAGRTPMAAVAGVDETTLRALCTRLGRGRPVEEQAHLALLNTRTRLVLSGRPDRLAEVQAALPERTTWEWLAVGGPFHSPLMAAGRAAMAETLQAEGFAFDQEHVIPVFDPATGEVLDSPVQRASTLLDSQFLRPVAWSRTVRRLAGLDRVRVLLDAGPGDGVARLSAASARGTGVPVLALSTRAGQEGLFTVGAEPAPTHRFGEFEPQIACLPDGRKVIDNRYTRATGQSPMILPGMTPTTVDVGIVAAAANAGYTAELAGGGQPTAEILHRRLAELAQRLTPGAAATFNALYLDRHLWGLHLGPQGQLLDAVRAGAPIAGVTISAGIPPEEEAVALLDSLVESGCTINAFKPGTVAQVEQVVRIAQAAPRHTIFVHLEGGRAGGHHSWEDLESLLLATWHRLREAPNVVLCVGGGVGDEARATALLTGRWSEAHGEPKMPVDALLLGTVTMACAEATTSPAVKAALVAAPGTPDVVLTGQSIGGVTSGKSGLDADIHYLDNAAARCGRLLDQVAGNPAAITERRDEIIAALAATARPYFGDIERMTWVEATRRLVELLAVGQHRDYDDGVWPDRSYRLRVADFLRLAESRLAAETDGSVESVMDSDARLLDVPEAAIEALLTRHPRAATERVHPADARTFVRSICARPGKPVCFVPVIDAEVRRWYKADSLWQAHHPRYTADQVLVIPGPAAVAGIREVDEPVASLLGRFEAAVVHALEAGGQVAQPRAQRYAWPRRALAGVQVEPTAWTARPGADPLVWFDALAARYSGPVAALFGALHIVEGTRRRPNPVRALCIAEPGAGLTLELSGTELTGLVWRSADRSEQVALRSAGEGVLLSVHPAAAPGGQAAVWTLDLAPAHCDGRPTFVVSPEAMRDGLRSFYLATLFSQAPTPVALFEPARDEVVISPERAAAHARLTGHDGAPAELAFSLVWQPLFRVLAADELAAGFLRLVHLDQSVEITGAWPPPAGVPLVAEARLTRIEGGTQGRTLRVEARLLHAGRPLAHLRSGFYVRGAAEPAGFVRAQESWSATLPPLDEAAIGLLAAAPEVRVTARDLAQEAVFLALRRAAGQGGRPVLRAHLEEHRPGRGPGHFRASGTLTVGSEVVDLEVDATGTGLHPLRALVAALGGPVEPTTIRTPRHTLASTEVAGPTRLATFAEVGGDRNPLHCSALFARLAGLPGPIVHGMWTAARLHAFARQATGSAQPLADWTVSFTAPVQPGERLRLDITRTGMQAGSRLIEATATAVRGTGEVIVARATARAPGLRTALVFPGQGIQRKGMGQDSPSAAARAIWARADAFTRSHLGFSILGIVRDNPTELWVNGERHLHPEGVLHLTRFTQPAMAVLAMAQVAELREAGVLADDVVAGGHSVGEYNALAAAFEVLPLEAVVEIVYQRGCVMHQFVPRDAAGRSAYAMGVIRPNLAGLDEAGALALVQAVAEQTGRFIQVVNFNVRDRQYAVTGDVEALAALATQLGRRSRDVKRPAWVEVPGVDVPFHSAVLRDGVPAFRATLEARLPAHIAPERLVDRYVPNLVAQAFRLEKAFAQAIFDETHSAVIGALLADWAAAAADPVGLTRTLLIELLAWQFASPVRWIESQELLVRPAAEGGLGVQRVLEVGVGYQPTLVGMMRQTLQSSWPPPALDVLNAEADRVRVLELQTDESSAPVSVADPVVAAVAAPAAPALTTVPAPSAGPPPADRPVTPGEALRTLLALQARVLPEQIRDDETIDGLFEGVSSRRNQVLLDLGIEFEPGPLDAAHELPISALAAELTRRAKRYQHPGPYLRAAQDEALKRTLGRVGLGRKDVVAWLESRWSAGPGQAGGVLDTLALEARVGASGRGGPLGIAPEPPADRSAAFTLLDQVVERYGVRSGRPLQRPAAASGGASVDAGVVRALEDRLVGPDGVLMQTARDLAERLGHRLEETRGSTPAVVAPDHLEAEHGVGYGALVAPIFQAARHLPLVNAAPFARRDVARLAWGGAVSVERLCAWAAVDAEVVKTAQWFARRLRARGVTDERAVALERIAAAQPGTAGAFAGQTALVSGASPDSIALEVVRHLLRGGARVVLTTTTFDRARRRFYRRLYRAEAGPGAELHVVPCNMASFQDIDALVDWLVHPLTEQVGATVRVRKPAFTPDLILPFGAVKDLATLDQIEARALAALRAMLVGVERLMMRVATHLRRVGVPAAGCHVLLPLSPNHGVFGGDGLYAESKAALEVLLEKWHSEQAAWGKALTLCGVRIGWVRGTGLMEVHDAITPRLEAASGLQTFSVEEMGAQLAHLCREETRSAARQAPLRVDLTGGFSQVTDLPGLVARLRGELEAEAGQARRQEALIRQYGAGVGRPTRPVVKPAMAWPKPAVVAPACSWPTSWPASGADLASMVVVVGFGEVGPCGSARTRFALEVAERLDPASVLELAWITGLVRWEDDGRRVGWVDVETGESVDEADIQGRYEAAVRARVGIRTVAGGRFNPSHLPVHATAFLDRDFTFPVGSQAEAQAFAAAEPTTTRIAFDARRETWTVTRAAGSEVRVLKHARLNRQVAGILPEGFDFSRYGIPADLIARVDPVALFNLIATVDAFMAAGLEPEELLAHVHPARVANTQGAGIGGMASLRRLYQDHILGRERQGDVLQETLINVAAAYVVQSYVGSYGAMAHPVGACATAAVSLEEGLDKILAGKAEVVVAGGFDDIGPEGAVGFADMDATADTDEMAAQGLDPDEISRSNDARRRGFVEAQGGGTLLLARGDVALRMNLPVYGVLAWAGSFGDGIQQSVPAPGMGALAAALGGVASPLGGALARHGLTADDIALVYKHDTSTLANDLNENALHHRMQTALGRSPGNPLFVVSQKTLTGHSKGGAAAWQVDGLLQCLATGTVPGNRNLDSVDPAMATWSHMAFTDETLQADEPIRAGLVTSLGFGHVSAVALLLHPEAFRARLSPEARIAWEEAVAERLEGASRRRAEVLMGETPHFHKRQTRRFMAADGTAAQADEEAAMLLNPAARLDPATGRFR
jgi:enoyl reductase-like protein/3-oxoacyl-ACP reductase-like protein/3-oxoacyl-(acyl-carrier-protein) synthase/acyl dehydratase